MLHKLKGISGDWEHFRTVALSTMQYSNDSSEGIKMAAIIHSIKQYTKYIEMVNNLNG